MQVEFFFDFSCPYAYLGSTQIQALASRCGAEVVWKPMLLGGVFRAVGTKQNMSEGMPSSKARHNLLDMHRWSQLWNVPFSMPSTHPMRTVAALRALLSIGDPSLWPRFIEEIYTSYWVRGDDIACEETIRAAASRAGLSASAIERAIAANVDPDIKLELRARTDEAIERGVFGAPAMFVGDELFWGQDRLDMVADALAPAARSMSTTRPNEKSGAVIDFYYDFSSPFAYLGSMGIEQVAADAGATLRWRPFLLGALFKQIGTPSVPIMAFGQAKQAYYQRDLLRWAEARDLPFSFSKHFPLRSVAALRVALLAGDSIGPLTHAIFKAVWTEQSPLSEQDLGAIVSSVGLDPALVAEAKEPASKQALFDATSSARSRGVFGAPTMVVSRDGAGDALFWGQDRLEMVGLAARGELKDADLNNPS